MLRAAPHSGCIGCAKLRRDARPDVFTNCDDTGGCGCVTEVGWDWDVDSVVAVFADSVVADAPTGTASTGWDWGRDCVAAGWDEGEAEGGMAISGWDWS
jgi:hypothetical protein